MRLVHREIHPGKRSGGNSPARAHQGPMERLRRLPGLGHLLPEGPGHGDGEGSGTSPTAQGIREHTRSNR